MNGGVTVHYSRVDGAAVQSEYECSVNNEGLMGLLQCELLLGGSKQNNGAKT